MKWLIALIVALSSVVGWESLPAQDDHIAAASPVTRVSPVTPAKPPPVADWTSVILARPLFAPDRRPMTPAMAHSAPEAMLPRLAGTIRANDNLIAIFAAPGSRATPAATPPPATLPGPGAGPPAAAAGDIGKFLSVKRAGVVAGWTVADITDGAVTLERDGRLTNLQVSYAAGPSAAHIEAPVTVVLHEKRTSAFLQP